ncbi:MAG: methanesulfonate monooxygenase [Polyangiales bacterium]
MSAPLSRAELRAIAEDVVYETSLLLDAQDFAGFLAQTTDDLTYRITAYSPEIRKEMTWLEHDRAGLVALFELLPRHHVNHAQWSRHAVVYRVHQETEAELHAVSSLLIHHTVFDVGDVHVDAGASRVFAVARYHDVLRQVGDRWLLKDRTARLETRQLGIGTHLIV